MIERAGGSRIPLFGRETGRSFRLGHWRKLRPGIRIQNGTHFPVEPSSGKRVPESTLKVGRAFPGAAPKPPARLQVQTSAIST